METTVKIKWDKPKEQDWLCADNISLALHAYCKNTKFEVITIESPNEIKNEIKEVGQPIHGVY